MKTLVIDLPDTVDLDGHEAKMLLASQLYEKGRVTLGQGAEIVGLSKRTFMELLGTYGVSVLNHSEEDIDSDLRNALDHNR